MLHYLAVHDLVWINTTITGMTLPFDYEKLEACMAAQYNYGESLDVPGQAANFLSTFLRKRPFAFGNVRTGFIATVAFLTANQYALTADDARAAEIVRAVDSGAMTPEDGIAAVAQPTDVGLRPGVTLRALVTHLCNERAGTLKLLFEGDEQ